MLGPSFCVQIGDPATGRVAAAVDIQPQAERAAVAVHRGALAATGADVAPRVAAERRLFRPRRVAAAVRAARWASYEESSFLVAVVTPRHATSTSVGQLDRWVWRSPTTAMPGSPLVVAPVSLHPRRWFAAESAPASSWMSVPLLSKTELVPYLAVPRLVAEPPVSSAVAVACVVALSPGTREGVLSPEV